MTFRRFPALPTFAALAALAVLSGCGGEAKPTAAAQAVEVAIEPATATVGAGGQQLFAAAVTGAVSTSVTWSVVEANGGQVTNGLYTAPGAAGTFHVRATSVADPARSATATITVTAAPPPPPVTVTISPGTGAVDACRTLAFTATVGNATNTAVTWSVQEGAAGGAVSAAGVYTAPAADGTYHVVATSVADGTKSAAAAVTVTSRVVSVAVNPPTVTVPAGGTATFTASVTTTCGTTVAQKTIDSFGNEVAN